MSSLYSASSHTLDSLSGVTFSTGAQVLSLCVSDFLLLAYTMFLLYPQKKNQEALKRGF
jgi:hypothetical protein